MGSSYALPSSTMGFLSSNASQSRSVAENESKNGRHQGHPSPNEATYLSSSGRSEVNGQNNQQQTSFSHPEQGSGDGSSDSRVDSCRSRRWANLLHERPSTGDSNAMSQWLLEVLAVSDLEKPLKEDDNPLADGAHAPNETNSISTLSLVGIHTGDSHSAVDGTEKNRNKRRHLLPSENNEWERLSMPQSHEGYTNKKPKKWDGLGK